MKRVYIKFGCLLGIMACLLGANAAEIKNLGPRDNSGANGNNAKTKDGLVSFAVTCAAATQSADLDINNVRTKIQNGGDMWWDLNNPKYEIPKVTDANSVRKHSLFAGALWIGGLGRGDGNLRIAAMTYRQRGSDFWPGTLDSNGVSTDQTRCEVWNKMFKVTREELLAQYNSSNTDVSKNIIEWPASGNPNTPSLDNQTGDLAPFVDMDGNPFSYNPYAGDFPALDPTREADKNLPKDQPDQMIWFIYNDRGNIHSETSGIPIGLELQTTAFAFQTNDEVNNMTFYRTKIVNRGFEALDQTYFGQWVDADLGNYSDDYVGCDVGRSLGYCYNGDDNDEGVLGYGLNPPSVGVDFFQGPTDTSGVELGMGAFVYYNNSLDPIQGDPRTAIEYYNFLRARWKNNNPVKFGSTGLTGSIDTKYMFDDGTNPATAGQPKWNEKSAGNSPGDRRFIQSAGPFTLIHGAVNTVTVGVVWARTTSGGATGSLNLLKLASDKAQKLFNNKFDLPDGPEPPSVEIQELENQLVMKLLNTDVTENYKEDIKNELNQVINYRFQGYMIYQLKDGTVSNSELDNVERARLVFQCDVKDNISTIINLEYDPDVSANIPKLKVNGANEGIQHTFNITEDAFATGSKKTLVNFKTYTYLIVAYGYPANDPLKLEPVQFLASRNTVKISGYPHKTSPEAGGSMQQSNYGDGPILKQITGKGNGGQMLEFSKETIDEILANGVSNTPVYLGGHGPVKIKVVDPLRVPNANFEFRFIEPFNVKVIPRAGSIKFQDSISAKSYWVLTNTTTGESVYSDGTLENKIETVQGKVSFGGATKTVNSLRDWGLAVEIVQVPSPGRNPYGEPTNGFIDYRVEFADDNRRWLTAVADNDADPRLNWIRSGTNGLNATTFDPYTHDFYSELDPGHNGNDSYDPYEVFEKIWDRRIGPYALCSRVEGPNAAGTVVFGQAWKNSQPLDNPLSELASIRLVITPDCRLWSKCLVLEMGEDKTLTEGNMEKFNMRWHNSMDVEYNHSDGSFIRWVENTNEKGRSWFPGYAVNLETGERLNLMFGEDSYLPASENGRDMIWNPTSTYTDGGSYMFFGGKHTIYVMGSYVGISSRIYKGPRYDQGDAYKALIEVPNTGGTPNQTDKRRVLSQAMWVIPAMAEQGYSVPNGVPPTEVSFTIHMRKPYNKSDVTDSTSVPRYTFSTESIFNNVNSETGKKSVNLINIVPNPYYATSGYESSAIDNRVKITNLPPKAVISIYTLNGTLVRRIEKDDDQTFVDWDLKNNGKVPVASGFYIIHVDCGDLGEKILKWYGVMRQLDLDTY